MIIRTFAVVLLVLVSGREGLCDENIAHHLQLTQLEMDISGIGRFTYAGTVEPGTEFSLAVPFKEVSDALRNLIINDPQSSVRYARIVAEPAKGTDESRLPNIRTMGELLHSMRGETVSIATREGLEFEGTLVSIERRPSPKEFVETNETLITVLTSKGVQAFSLDQIKFVLPLRHEMKEKIELALKKELSRRDGDQREIEIQFGGTGPRNVTIQVTRPVSQWRTAYSYSKTGLQQRIIFENNTNQSWRDINILFTDRTPVLFSTPIYEMAFADRPEVAMPGRTVSLPSAMVEALTAFSPEPKVAPDQWVFDESNSSGYAGGMGGMGGGMGGMGGFSGSAGDGRESSTVGRDSNQAATFEVPQSKWAATPKDIGAPFAASFSDLSVDVMKTQLVSMPNLQVDAQPLLVYRQSYHETKPLMSLEIINRMPFRLPSGPMTIFDELGNAGEAMLPTLVPHVKQMVNYAIDNEVVVRRQVEPKVVALEGLDIDNAKHELTVSTRETQRHAYQVENRSPVAKILLIEHPKPQNQNDLRQHELREHDLFDSETAEHARYRLQTKSKENVTVEIVSERAYASTIPFGKIEPKVAQGWLSHAKVSDGVKQRLGEILDLRRKLDAAKAKASDIATAISLQRAEVDRIRGVLQSTISPENRKLYDVKMGECEKRISELEKEASEVAVLGLGLMKQLGSTETPVFQAPPYGTNHHQRWLDVQADPFGERP